MSNSLAEKLMKLDRGDLTAAKRLEVRVDTLSEKLGEDVYVTLRSLPGSEYAEYGSMTQNKKGGIDTAKAYDVQALMVAESIEGIDVKDPELQKHFGAATPKDLVKILFPGGELTKMSNYIGYLSGYLTAEDIGLEDTGELGLEYKDVKN